MAVESDPVEQTAGTSEVKFNSEELNPASEAPSPEPEAVETVAPVSEPVEEVTREESSAPVETAPESATTSESETSLPPQNP